MTDHGFDIQLRPTKVSDLETLFRFQIDEDGGYMAAFTPQNLHDKSAYLIKHTKLLNDPTVNNQTVIANGIIAGSIGKFEIDGNAEITYWFDRNYWGKGIATKALKAFLLIESTRPIVGRVAFDNIRSRKVLENCGFVMIGSDKGFANARQTEIEEFIYRLT